MHTLASLVLATLVLVLMLALLMLLLMIGGVRAGMLAHAHAGTHAAL